MLTSAASIHPIRYCFLFFKPLPFLFLRISLTLSNSSLSSPFFQFIHLAFITCFAIWFSFTTTNIAHTGHSLFCWIHINSAFIHSFYFFYHTDVRIPFPPYTTYICVSPETSNVHFHIMVWIEIILNSQFVYVDSHAHNTSYTNSHLSTSICMSIFLKFSNILSRETN